MILRLIIVVALLLTPRGGRWFVAIVEEMFDVDDPHIWAWFRLLGGFCIMLIVVFVGWFAAALLAQGAWWFFTGGDLWGLGWEESP